MAALTKPQFSMGFIQVANFTLNVTLDSSFIISAGVVAGTYFLDGNAGGFLDLLATSLTDKDIIATGDGVNWDATISPTTGQVTFTRNSTTSRTLTFFAFSSGDGRTVGASKDVYDGTETDEVLTRTGTTIVFTGLHSARYVWQPQEFIMRNEFQPERSIARSVSVSGRVITDFFSSTWDQRTIDIIPVLGARVYQWMTDDATFAGEASVATGDPNVALETFWEDLSVHTVNGTPPTVRLAPDETDLTLYSEIWLSGEAWLQAMSSAVTEIDSQPTIYDIDFQAQSVVT